VLQRNYTLRPDCFIRSAQLSPNGHTNAWRLRNEPRNAGIDVKYSLSRASQSFVLLELAVQRGFADAQPVRRGELISVGFVQGLQDGAAL